MKKIFFLVICVFINTIFTGCSNNETENDEQLSTINETNVKRIATKYGYTFSKKSDSNNVTIAKNIPELINFLEIVKNNFSITHISKLNSPNTNFSDDDINKLIDKKINEISIKKKGSVLINSRDTSDGPPYSYSTTFYFDNTFPCSNVSVTISYNVNSQGQVTEADFSSTTYGYSHGSTYSQGTGNIHYQGGSIAFSFTGGFNTSMGIGSFSMSNTNNAQYTGYVQIGNGGSGSGGTFSEHNSYGYCKQQQQDGLMDQ